MNSQIVIIKQVLRSRSVIILVLCLIPISLFLQSGFISAAVIWFVTFCTYNYYNNPTRPPYYRIWILPVIFFFAYAIGASYSGNFESGLNLVLRKIHLAAIPFGFVLLDHRKFEQYIHDVVIGIFLTCCIVSSLACIGASVVNMSNAQDISFFVADEQYFYFTSHALSSPLNVSPVYLSMYYNVALLIVFVSRLIKNSTLKYILGIYFIVFIILCGSAVGIISAFFILFLWLAQIGNRKILLTGLLITLAAVAIAVVIDRARIKDMAANSLKFTYTNDDRTQSIYAADRLKIWTIAASTINRANWLTGYGTGNGQKALEEKYTEKRMFQELRDELNPHNQFISTTLDLGVIGLFLLGLILTIPMLIAIRNNAFLPFGFLMITTIFFCAESVLLRQKGIVFFSFFYCLLISEMGSTRTRATS